MRDESKELGKEMAEAINELNIIYKRQLINEFVKNIDNSTRAELENAMEVVI